MKNRLNASALILGLTSMVGQIIIIRELIVVFYGNELSLGVILAAWLFWTSLGSALLGRLVDRLRSRERFLSNTQIATAIALPLTIFLIRNIKALLNIPTGRIIGFVPMLGSSFVSLAITCILLGFTFALISKIATEKTGALASSVGRIYLLEGLGASIGGLVYSFFLIKTLGPFQNAFIVGSLNLAISLLFNRNILQLLYLVAISAAFIFNWASSLEQYTRKLQFRPFEVKESIDSIYGNITVTKIGQESSFYENGLLVFTTGDYLTSEETVHYALLSHPSPERVLIIGGGAGGPLKEILKHPVKSVDYVELDPLIIKLTKKYASIVKDRRLNIAHKDGRLFVKQYSSRLRSKDTVRASEESRELPRYDVIILNLPDPYNAMLNRFYSLEFFKEAKKILSTDGILSFALTSSENYLNPEQAYYLASIKNTLKKEFQEIKIFPGDSATFMASNKPGMLTYDSNLLIDRLRARNINTQFVREYYLPFKLSPMRIEYLEDSIKEAATAKINQDFKPIGYFYHLSLWTSLFYSGKGLLPLIEKINLNLLILSLSILFVLAFLIIKLKKLSFSAPVTLSIATTGMSEICFQIIVILAFQFLYGYMYYKIGLILTSFMIGLVLGSFSINRLLEKIKDARRLYLKTQVFICIYPLILPLVFTYIAKVNVAKPEIANSLQLSFAFLPVIAGFLGGFQFPLANKICLKSPQEVGKRAGFLYGMDLFGACLGGLLVGLFLIPIIGIIQTCLVLFIINTLVLIILILSRSR